MYDTLAALNHPELAPLYKYIPSFPDSIGSEQDHFWLLRNFRHKQTFYNSRSLVYFWAIKMELQYSFSQSATLEEQAYMESFSMTTSDLPDEQPRDEAFKALVARVRACRLCPRMDSRIRVLGYGNGNIHTRVLFVAEAP